VVRDEVHGRALDAAGVNRVLNPFNDAADYAARSFAAEIAFEDAHRAASSAVPQDTQPPQS
jgi:Trk K+ transport system NAD-binding subunit